MKKAAAMIASVIFYMAAFTLSFIMGAEHHLLLFSILLPLVIAAYFVIAGNIFSRRLHLNRWHLWLFMNFIGGICSWGILIACFPGILFNGFILFYLMPVTVVFAVVWAAVWIGFLFVKNFRHRPASAPHRERQTISTRPEKTRLRGEKTAVVFRVAGILGLVLAMACLYAGATGVTSVRSASDYEDKGVHTFSPCKVLPVQVENTSTGRDKRQSPTKTVYVVYYQATDGSGYQWQVETGNSKNAANQIFAEGKSVERRVLSIKDNGKYITVEAGQSADTYTAARTQGYVWQIGLSVGYLVIFLAVWVVVWRRQNKRIAER